MNMSEDGLITISQRIFGQRTIDRLESLAKSHGLTIFARVDHAGGAAQVGMPLRPTELFDFRNPKGGTPVMQDHQTAGLDLPLKALAWEMRMEKFGSRMTTRRGSPSVTASVRRARRQSLPSKLE